MADELNKKNPSFDSGSSSESAPKPKTIGTPAPNVPKPKQTPTAKPQLAPKSSMPKKMTVKPGNPNLGESAPVGIQRKRFESDKHANKRLNKMFDETKAATLGVWNHDNTHPMAKPDSVKFNPKLNYKPSKEALEAANRKKIMDQGFRPKSDQEVNKLMNDAKSQQTKAPKFDYDSISKELDSGEMVNIDAGLLPYEHGFETNGYEDVAVDARKGEDGKYELYMYTETEDGPKEGYEEPAYVFDSFDDMKAFIENGYKKVEKPKWDPVNEPGSGAITKELVDFVRQQLKADGGLNDNFIDAYLSKMPQNSNQADYWKGKYQEAWNKKYGGNK